MIKIKNRNHYDIIYECLIHCRDYEKSTTFPTTKSRFMSIFGGNSKVAKTIFPILTENELIEVNKEVEHYSDVYKVTDNGYAFIDAYEDMKRRLGHDI